MKEQITFFAQKRAYDPPRIEKICFDCVDIITTSGNFDTNQGEWDPQTIDEVPIF